MKYIKLFDKYSQNDPISILQSYIPGLPLHNFELTEDNKINANQFQIHLNDLELTRCPVYFKNVYKAHFIIDNNELTTLEGCPENLPDGFFSCSNNRTLMSLEFMPNTIKVFYDHCGCSDDVNQLKWLPIDAMKKGQVYNHSEDKGEKSFTPSYSFSQEDTDNYWDYILENVEPNAFPYLKYGKSVNPTHITSNCISSKLAQKYLYLIRGDKAELWNFKKKK